MKKLLAVLTAAALLGSALAGCSKAPAKEPEPAENSGTSEETQGEDSQEEEKEPEGSGYKVAFTVPTMNNPFFVDQIAGAQKAADERGIQLLTAGAVDHFVIYPIICDPHKNNHTFLSTCKLWAAGTNLRVKNLFFTLPPCEFRFTLSYIVSRD